METSKTFPDIAKIAALVGSVNTQMPDWAKSTLDWLSESPAWASSILSQSSLVFHLTVNDKMLIRELSSGQSSEKLLIGKMSESDRFKLHAFPGTHAAVKEWMKDQTESLQQEVLSLLDKIQEMDASSIKAWNTARNLFPLIGDTQAPFLALTFSFAGSPANSSTDMPEPSTLKLWDLGGNAQLLTHLQQGSVSFYLCELNLPTLLTVLLQITTVFILSVIKWVSKISALLSDLMEGAVDSLRKIPKEVLLATLGALAAALLIPAVRGQLGEWLSKSKEWFAANQQQLLAWAGNWAAEAGLILEWIQSLALLGGLLTEQVWADLSDMLKEFTKVQPAV
jgi:hypothetical protein